MHTKTVTTLLAAASLAASAAYAQTVGIGATTTAYTAQAGAAISKVVSEKAGIQMRVQPHGGTSAYVPSVNNGTLEFGLANELETLYAVTGTEIYEGRAQANLRVVTVLTPFSSGLYVRKDSNIHSLRDLKGKRLPSGWASQKIIGVLLNGVLATAGMSMSDVEQVPVPNVVKGADDFAAGKTDAFFFAVGAGKVKETEAKVGGLRAIPIETSPEAIAAMRKHVPPSYAKVYQPSPIAVGVEKPTAIMSYDYLVLANDKVSDDIVYRVVKSMHDNKDILAAAFPALRQFDPKGMSKKFEGGVQFHSGAIKFYTETGQWPPK
jgi:hypothetical protein